MPARRTPSWCGIRLATGLALACSAAGQGCSDVIVVPVTHGDRVLVPGTEIAAAVVFDIDRRIIVRQIGPPLVAQGATILLGTSLFTSGRLASGDDVFLELDVRTGRERARVVVGRGGEPIALNDVVLGRQIIALDPAARRLYCWGSIRDGLSGVGVLDLGSGAVVEFRRVALRRGGVAMLPATARYPSGALLAFGDDGNADFSRAVIYVLTGTPLAIRDSVVLRPPSRRIQQVETLPGGGELLVGTNAEILRIDVATGSVTARASRPNTGSLTRSDTDGRFFIAAPGSFEVPTQNLIHVLWPSLELAGIVDLRGLPEPVQPLAIAGSVVSADGRWLYIVAGVARDGAPYGPQQTRILVLDTGTLAVADVLSLATFGVGRPLLAR